MAGDGLFRVEVALFWPTASAFTAPPQVMAGRLYADGLIEAFD